MPGGPVHAELGGQPVLRAHLARSLVRAPGPAPSPGRAATAPRYLAGTVGGLVQTTLISPVVARATVIGGPVIVSTVVARTVIVSASVVSPAVVSTVIARVRSAGPVPLVVPLPPGTAVSRIPGTACATAVPVTTPALSVARTAPSARLSGIRGVGAGKVWVTHASSLVG